jgi:hypothetical protein
MDSVLSLKGTVDPINNSSSGDDRGKSIVSRENSATKLVSISEEERDAEVNLLADAPLLSRGSITAAEIKTGGDDDAAADIEAIGSAGTTQAPSVLAGMGLLLRDVKRADPSARLQAEGSMEQSKEAQRDAPLQSKVQAQDPLAMTLPAMRLAGSPARFPARLLRDDSAGSTGTDASGSQHRARGSVSVANREALHQLHAKPLQGTGLSMQGAEKPSQKQQPTDGANVGDVDGESLSSSSRRNVGKWRRAIPFHAQGSSEALLFSKHNREMSLALSEAGQPKRSRWDTSRVPDGAPAALRSHRSLFLFRPGNRFRTWCYLLLSWPAFQAFNLAVILFSCVVLTLDTPRMDPASGLADFLYWSNLAVVVVFAAEALLQLVSLGGVLHPGSYFRNSLHVTDFAVLVICAAGLFSATGRGLFVFRALRAIRPVRLVRTVPALRNVLLTLSKSALAFANVMLLSFFYLFVFGIVGVQFFAGRFYSCNDDSVAGETECTGTFLAPDGSVTERVWSNAAFHFDNIFAGMLSMFQLTTLEDWPTMLANAVDVTEVGRQPQRDHSLGFALFIIVSIFVGIFLFNIFVGVLAFYFRKQMDEREGAPLLDLKQRMWMQTIMWLTEVTPLSLPPIPTGPGLVRSARRRVMAIVESPRFEMVSVVVILCNTVVMASLHYGQPEWWTVSLEVLDIIFTALYFLEALLRFCAQTPRWFYRDVWNLFDVTIVVISIIGIALRSRSAAVVRILRIMRLPRLSRTSNALRGVFSALFSAIPSMWAVGLLILMVMYIYAVIAVQVGYFSIFKK